jgi:hypothetical protein
MQFGLSFAIRRVKPSVPIFRQNALLILYEEKRGRVRIIATILEPLRGNIALTRNRRVYPSEHNAIPSEHEYQKRNEILN